MVIMNDLEWPMLSYYVIYYEKFIKFMQRTEKEALKWSSVIDVYNVLMDYADYDHPWNSKNKLGAYMQHYIRKWKWPQML